MKNKQRRSTSSMLTGLLARTAAEPRYQLMRSRKALGEGDERTEARMKGSSHPPCRQ